ncbi:MAG: hypothetical protein WKF79_00090 [Nocardioides sp.]
MTCDWVPMPGGGHAIICSRSTRRPKCRGCGRPATLECDWKKPRKKSGTCDAPICGACSISPAPDKDVCPACQPALAAWRASR